MSFRAFTAVRLPITGSNSTDRTPAESKRLTCRVTAEQPQQPLAAVAYVSETTGVTDVVSGEERNGGRICLCAGGKE